MEYVKELTSIYEYIKVRLKEEQIAKRLLTKIQKELIELQYFPKRSRLITKDKNKKLYRLIIKKHIIIYKVNDKSKEIYILHIFNSRQNYFKFI